MRPPTRALSGAVVVSAAVLSSFGVTSGCIDRPIGTVEPRTTSILTTRFDQTSPTKLDLLLVVDNSASMADKQRTLAKALPDLINTLITPPCVRADGSRQLRSNIEETCEPGSKPEFEPLADIQVGVITSSLGGFGSPHDCQQPQQADMGHLLATRPRASDIASNSGVLSWRRGEDPGPFMQSFTELVPRAGDFGCGWESGLEAWYRFLIDPTPYQAMERQACREGDTSARCARAVRDGAGQRLIDQELLAQRRAFLRPDSLLLVLMLSDENDCSFREHEHSWLLSQAQLEPGIPRAAYRASDVCETDPDAACCHSCALAPPEGCPSETNEKGQSVGAGCANNSGRFDITEEPSPDPANLRCFDQKRRFGLDLLYPEQRYVNALSSPQLCPLSDTLDPNDCGAQDRIDNPLFPGARGGAGRASADEVFLVGLLGVPWQDLAKDPAPSAPLEYLPAAASTTGTPAVHWAWLLGEAGAPPGDALMRESIEPRVGENPATSSALVSPDVGRLENPINGHESTNLARDDLQFACIFPLEQARTCPTVEEDQKALQAGTPLPSCDCTGFESDEPHRSPLCLAEDGSYDNTQRFAKAYPSLRQLRVLQRLGEGSVVASICPKQLSAPNASDFGYRPAMRAIVNKLKGKLQALCLDRSLAVDSAGVAECQIIEVRPDQPECECQGVRSQPTQAQWEAASQELQDQGWCSSDQDCARHCGCLISQLPAGSAELNSCQHDDQSTADGWCYVDAERGVGAAELVASCPSTERRKIRFLGEAIPADGSTTLLACAGSTLGAEE